jgi:hypothetical protein
MRHLMTFILRLWVDPDASPASCEGQVECVATGEQMHIHSQAETAAFIMRRLDPHSNAAEAATSNPASLFERQRNDEREEKAD